MPPRTPPPSLLRDGFLLVAADGALAAANDVGERWLQANAAGGASLDALPLDDDQRAALRRGEPVVWRAPPAAWQLRLRDVDGERWLTIEDVADRDRDAARRLELARVRALAGIAANLAHDLNNQFNAALGVAGQAQLHMPGEDDRALLRGLETGIQAGSRMASVLARWLVREPGARERVAPAQLLEETMAVVHKALVGDGVALQVDAQPSLPQVRTAPVVAGQAILHGLMAIGSAGATALALSLAEHESDGRRHVRLTIDARGLREPFVTSVVDVVNGARGMLAGLATNADLEGVFGAVVAQRRVGGAIAAEALPDGLRLCYDWPVARSSAS